MIHVIAKIKTLDGKRDAFLAEFHKLVPTVLEEVGCVSYGPTIDAKTDIAGQELAGDDTVIVIEQWESVNALKDHLAADHMQLYREKVKDLVDTVSLEIYETA